MTFFEHVHPCIYSVYKISNVLMLQELFHYQEKFARHYFDGLDGCGLELESKVRQSYYGLLRYLVGAIKSVSRIQLPP